MTEELHELHEHAEHGKHAGMAPVTVTMAILAVLVALVTLLGHRASTDQIVLQNRVTDQWAYYQAKSIRRHTDELFADLTELSASRDSSAAQQLHDKYSKEAERYKEEQTELDAEARKLETETGHAQRMADRFDLGEVFLEIALVITSITLLSGKRTFWYVGMLLGAAGVLVSATAFFA